MKKIASMFLFAAAMLATSPAAFAKDVYLFAYFRGEKDGLHLAYSHDGLKWTALNGNRSLLVPTVGADKLMRDPSICQGPDGTFHMVWTSSWRDRIIGYASSKDLIHWSEQRAIPVMMHEPDALNCWAPELYYDETTGKFWIYWATSIPGRHKPIPTSESEKQWSHRIYATTTRDFVDFTPAKLWFDPPYLPIDSAVVKSPVSGDLIMIVKNENSAPPAKNLLLYRSQSMETGFAPEPVPAPFTPKGLWCEGPAPLFVGNDLFVYYDCYRNGRYGVAVSKDDGKTWEDRSADLSLPKGIRHGTALRVSSNVLSALLETLK